MLRRDLESGGAAAIGRPLQAVRIAGPSMVPTLRHDDVVLVARVRVPGRAGLRIRPGDVVLGVFPARPDLLVVKRAIRPDGTGWWLRGDNDVVTDDSRRYGPAEVVGKVLARYWPPRRVALIAGRRIGNGGGR